MKIRYIDEYGNDVFDSNNSVGSNFLPLVGDTVTIDDEDYRVKSRIFYPMEDEAVVELTQNQIKSKSSDDVGDRLAEMQRAIVKVNKRQDTQEKKSTRLNEQLVSVRTYLRTQRTEKK